MQFSMSKSINPIKFTVNVEIFAFFAMLPSSLKFPSRENKTCLTLLRKLGYNRENNPHVKGLANIFAKFPLSENNHVHSNYSLHGQVITQNI